MTTLETINNARAIQECIKTNEVFKNNAYFIGIYNGISAVLDQNNTLKISDEDIEKAMINRINNETTKN